MNEYIGTIVELITIVTFVAGVVNYTIIKPLRVSIDSLTSTVSKVESLIEKIQEDGIRVRERVVLVELEVKKLNGRFEAVEQYLMSHQKES